LTKQLEGTTYGNLHALLSDHLHAAHHILLHLNELGELLGQVGTEGATGVAAESMAEASLAEETTGLGGGGRRRGVLELRRSGSARLAHGVRAMHVGCGWVGETVSAWCVALGDRRGGDAGEYL